MVKMSDIAATQELDAVFDLQKKASLKNQCRPIEERKAKIGKMPAMVLKNKCAIRKAME